MELFSSIALGLDTALSFNNLLYCFIGVVLGMIIGVIPGVGVLAAMSMLFPVTFYLEPTTAMIMLAGIWYGSTYGGSIASILLNLPGTPQNAVTCLDGYPMARQGRGGIALFMTTVASMFGGAIGIFLLMLFAPSIASLALSFGPAEYFSLMVMGLVGASFVAGGSMIKGLAMIVLGILIGIPGIDIYTASERFTFGLQQLHDGIAIAALAMGIFGVAEVVGSVRRIHVGDIDRDSVKLRAMVPTRDDVRRSWFPMLRGSSVGAFVGALPGTGPAIATFLAYALERRVAREPERFGKGAIEGIMSPEAANNAADQTAFIPTLTLGIPGSATMALMLGALMIHGVTPGPSLMREEPSLFWGLIMSFWIGNLMLVVLNVPLIGIWVRLLMIPYRLMYPTVLMFICMGSYTLASNPFDVWVVLFFGVLGYLMRVLDFPAAPLILGCVLGPLMEEHFRRAMIISRGDFSFFIDRPISASFLMVSVALIGFGVWSGYRLRRRGAALRNA
jgi:TctA family transporter